MYIKKPRHGGPGLEEYAVLAVLILAAASALLVCYAAHPLYHDEAMYAEVPREMLLGSGSLITPTLNFAPFLYKPPLYIWSNALSMRLFGGSWLAVRLPGILFSLGSVSFTLLIASRLGRAAGLYAAAALATSFGFVFHNTTMLTDHLLVFLVAGSLYFFLRVTEGGRNSMAALYAC